MALVAPKEYRDEILAARPSRMVVMLFDQAISALNDAIAAIERNDIEERCNAVNTAFEILGTLYEALDIDAGHQIAVDLGSLYSHLMGRLLRVNMKNDPEIAREVIAALNPLRDSWHKVDVMVASGRIQADAKSSMSAFENEPLLQTNAA